MLLVIPDVLTRDEALAMGRTLATADRVAADAGAFAGEWATPDQPMPTRCAAIAAARAQIEAALARNATFLSAALPRLMYPPMFNRYGPGDGFGAHVHDAIRRDPAGAQIRTDLSATLFLSEGYRGGKLTIDSPFGAVAYALPAGHMVLYSGAPTRQVTQVTSGERLACFFWLQSLVRDDGARETLYDIDQAVQALVTRRA
ncbi:Fe2+-dependent dioxygenase [Novosphingobium sp.]|uniref:Fe2+-dependent dioxygenase n=1 Tax=Novosphingobium sp. TaxID=1874826 RepID=UPI003D105289